MLINVEAEQSESLQPIDSLCVSLVHQYLESTQSALADQFKNTYQPKKFNINLKEELSK